jgi:competence protein ComEC
VLDSGDGVSAEVLAPSGLPSAETANDASLVLLLHYGRTTFLLTGDAEAPEEAEILATHPNLKCDVLKIGHHGSHTSTSPDFLAAAHPQYAVISVGKRNIFGHPSPDVVGRLRASGAAVLRTDRNGAITCRSDGINVKMETMLK